MSSEPTTTPAATPTEKALAKAEQTAVVLSDSGAVKLQTLDEALRFCKWAVESGLLPNGIKTVAQAFVILQKGAELGFPAMASYEFIYPVNGRPRLTPAGALAKAKASGLLADYDERTEGEGDKLKAVVVSLRNGAKRPVVTEFSMFDAKVAGLLGKDNWKHYPKRMVLARARGFNLQDNFTDLLGGLQVRETFDLDPDEVIDVEPAKMPAPKSAPPGPDPLLAGEAPAVIDVTAESVELAPCCGKPHGAGEECP